ncbi:elongation factor Ts, mitochondrial [Trifolium repens]|nr:elongation factor Ts, mitochondrial [Trifolium repens]
MPSWLVTNIPIMWLLAFKVEAFGKSQYMIIDKMVEGCLHKYFEDFVVMDQTFVMNDTMKVKISAGSAHGLCSPPQCITEENGEMMSAITMATIILNKESPENSLVLLDARNLNGTMIGKFHSPIVETLVHC